MKAQMLQLIRSLEPDAREEFLKELQEVIQTVASENPNGLTEAQLRYCQLEGIDPADFRK